MKILKEGGDILPGLDRTGPLGMGPMTGRGLGLCTPWGRRFWRYGFGWGWGVWGPGFGRGRGRGWRWFGRWLGWGPWAFPFGSFFGPKEEKEILKDEAQALREELNAIEERLRELETKQAQA